MKDFLQWGRRGTRAGGLRERQALSLPWPSLGCCMRGWGIPHVLLHLDLLRRRGETGQGEMKGGRHMRRGRRYFLLGVRRTPLISFLSLQTQGLLLGGISGCVAHCSSWWLSTFMWEMEMVICWLPYLFSNSLYIHRISHLTCMCYFICKISIHSWPLNKMVWSEWVPLLTGFFFL